jgi:hypothetical protein
MLVAELVLHLPKVSVVLVVAVVALLVMLELRILVEVEAVQADLVVLA